MHRVTAVEKHRVRHPGSIVMTPFRLGVLPIVDIRLYDVASVVHIIAEHRRNVVLVLPHDRVAPGRSRKAGFPGRDSRFADQLLALVKISALLRQAHYDLGGTRNAFAVPVTRWRRSGGRRRGVGRFDLGAARYQSNSRQSQKSAKEGAAVHVDADGNVSHSGFNPKDLPNGAGSDKRGWDKIRGRRVQLFLPRAADPASLTG
jgi:hypothetical protein